MRADEAGASGHEHALAAARCAHATLPLAQRRRIGVEVGRAAPRASRAARTPSRARPSRQSSTEQAGRGAGRGNSLVRDPLDRRASAKPHASRPLARQLPPGRDARGSRDGRGRARPASTRPTMPVREIVRVGRASRAGRRRRAAAARRRAARAPPPAEDRCARSCGPARRPSWCARRARRAARRARARSPSSLVRPYADARRGADPSSR